MKAEDFEYLVKFKGRAYRACQWLSFHHFDPELQKRRIRPFNLKHLPPSGPSLPKMGEVEGQEGSGFFNPLYLRPEKVLGLRNRKSKELLVKWRGLGYAEATWEEEEELLEHLDLLESSFLGRIKEKKGEKEEEFEGENEEKVKKMKKEKHFEDFDLDSLLREFDEGNSSEIQAKCSDFKFFSGSKPFPSDIKKEGFDFFPNYCEEVPSSNPSLPPTFSYSIPSSSEGKSDGRSLFDFQYEGVKWMLSNFALGMGCILADEMGLGKTVQTSVFLDHAIGALKRHQKSHRRPSPSLIVAPLSTLENWRREVKAWTNLRPIVFHGSQRDRAVIRKYEMRGSVSVSKGDAVVGPRPRGGCPKWDVLITSFEMLSNVKDSDVFSEFEFAIAVYDEAHRLKSLNSQIRQSALNVKAEHTLLLTGTPIQNNLEELWSLLNLCNPGKWPSRCAGCRSGCRCRTLDNFKESYGSGGSQMSGGMIEVLRKEIMYVLLQRRKAEVMKHLVPAKEETIISVELTTLQKQTYRALYERNMSMFSGLSSKNRPSLMNLHMELRKCCNHPFLIKGVEPKILGRSDFEASGHYSAEEMDVLLHASGKLVFLDKLLDHLVRTENSKVLVFSQFAMMLDLIADYLRWRGYAHERLDGGVSSTQRQEAIDRFNREDEGLDHENHSFVFLLSTKAGGVGLNLIAARSVVLFDHDWNPQNDLQAQARCHRIGQTKNVTVYRLVTRNTYESHMFSMANIKLGLEQAVMAGSGEEGSKMSKEDMDRLLKEGAFALVDDLDESQKFCDETIQEILEKRATKVKHDEGESVAKKSMFSQALFKVNENHSAEMEIDIDDPNFWEKVKEIGGVTEATPESEEGVEGGGGRRRQMVDYRTGEKFEKATGSSLEPSPESSAPFRDISVEEEEEKIWEPDDKFLRNLVRGMLNFGFWAPPLVSEKAWASQMSKFIFSLQKRIFVEKEKILELAAQIFVFLVRKALLEKISKTEREDLKNMRCVFLVRKFLKIQESFEKLQRNPEQIPESSSEIEGVSLCPPASLLSPLFSHGLQVKVESQDPIFGFYEVPGFLVELGEGVRNAIKQKPLQAIQALEHLTQLKFMNFYGQSDKVFLESEEEKMEDGEEEGEEGGGRGRGEKVISPDFAIVEFFTKFGRESFGNSALVCENVVLKKLFEKGERNKGFLAKLESMETGWTPGRVSSLLKFFLSFGIFPTIFDEYFGFFFEKDSFLSVFEKALLPYEFPLKFQKNEVSWDVPFVSDLKDEEHFEEKNDFFGPEEDEHFFEFLKNNFPKGCFWDSLDLEEIYEISKIFCFKILEGVKLKKSKKDKKNAHFLKHGRDLKFSSKMLIFNEIFSELDFSELFCRNSIWRLLILRFSKSCKFREASFGIESSFFGFSVRLLEKVPPNWAPSSDFSLFAAVGMYGLDAWDFEVAEDSRFPFSVEKSRKNGEKDHFWESLPIGIWLNFRKVSRNLRGARFSQICRKNPGFKDFNPNFFDRFSENGSFFANFLLKRAMIITANVSAVPKNYDIFSENSGFEPRMKKKQHQENKGERYTGLAMLVKLAKKCTPTESVKT